MTQSRHEQLVAAGWRRSATQDRYAAPGSATDGTERFYNEAAAWHTFQAVQASEATSPGTKAPRTRAGRDPRRQEPQ